jgi:PAS domain S-box-containing protein
VLKGGESTWSQDQLVPIYRNGTLEDVYWTFSYSPIKDEEGKVRGVLVVCNETTTSILAKKRIEESEHRFRSLIEAAPVPMCLYSGRDMKIEIVNDALLATWGKDRSVIGKTLKEAIPELEGQPFLKLLDDVYTTGKPYVVKNTEAKVVREGKLGNYYYDLWYTPMYDTDNNINGVLATGVEVTDKVIAQQKTEESENNLRNIIMQAPVAMCIFRGAEYVVEIANERMLQFWGNPSGELVGKPIFIGLPESKNQGFEELLNTVYTSGKTYKANGVPVTLPRETGIETVFMDFVYEPFREPDGIISGVMAVSTDVTEQVLSAKRVQLSEERLRIAIDSGGLGTFEMDYSSPDKAITSSRFNEIFGSNNKISLQEFISLIHPDDLEIRNHAHKESLTTGRIFYEVRIVNNDKIKWVRIAGKILYNKEGEPEKLLGVVDDITNQKNLQVQKDNFIAMASHELKTPVTSIKAYGQVLQEMLRNKGSLKEADMMVRMDTQVNRLNNLISDLLNITKINSGKLEYHKMAFNFNELVKEMTEELQRTTNKHKLNLNLAKAVTVFADKERISQVITNFISNAIKYSPDAEIINISTTINENEINCCVQDFGIGINAESQQKVFEQFYRVNDEKHQTFQGFGLGLYISSEIIKREGGKIWVTSTEGKGSEFCFSLPISV